MRKPWRVDLKWIFGIIFTLFMIVLLTTLFLLNVSSESPANIANSSNNNSMFGLENNPVTKIFQKAKDSPESYVEIPEIGRLDIKGNDINNLSMPEAGKLIEQSVEKKVKTMSPRELDKIADNFSKELQKQVPAQELRKLEDNPSEAIPTYLSSQIQNPLMMIGSPIYEGFLKTIAGFAMFFVFIGFIGLLCTSYRSGKLTSPGVGLIIASTPGSIAFLLGKSLQGVTGQLQGAPAEIISNPFYSILPIIAEKGSVFPIFFGIGCLLIIVGFIVGIIMLSVRPKRSARVAKIEEPVQDKKLKTKKQAKITSLNNKGGSAKKSKK